jgi:V8-like Glu-specific endopeptidase
MHDTDTAPSSLDEIARRPNIAASEPEPPHVQPSKHRSETVITLTRPPQPDEASPPLRRIEGIDFDAWAVDHESLMVGIPGRELQQLSVAEVEEGAQDVDEIAPLRPSSVDVVFNPERGPEPEEPLLRSIDGRALEPAKETQVFGPEDRQVLYPKGYPWHCIGLLEVWWGDLNTANPLNPPTERGSAFLVGRRTIVTASHVIPWSRPREAWKARFIPGYYWPSSTYGVGVQAWVGRAAAYEYVLDEHHISAKDIAVCELMEAPLPYKLGNALGTIGVKTYSSSWQGMAYWTIVGYPWVPPFAFFYPAYQQWVSIDGDSSVGNALELTTHADISKGNSGGPVFGWWGSVPWAIGVVSGMGDAPPANYAAGGELLVNIVKWAHSQQGWDWQ